MKRILALILTLCLLLVLSACGDKQQTGEKKNENNDEKVTIYLVTSQKTYQDGELTGETTFAYDEQGHPLRIEWEQADGSGYQFELEYDKYGNRIHDALTRINAEGSIEYQHQIDYDLTYRQDWLTRYEIHRDGSEFFQGFDLSYDDKGRLVLVEYDKPEVIATGMDIDWYSYEYDRQGRLTAETWCMRSTTVAEGQATLNFCLTRVCYVYDENGNLIEHETIAAQTATPVTPDQISALEFRGHPDYHYFFQYDQNGTLIRTEDASGNVLMDSAIQDNSDYIFDEHGNLLSVEKNGYRRDYTYTALELDRRDAEIVRRMLHGVSGWLQVYAYFATMDPVFWETYPVALYSPVQSQPFYYLANYSLWNIKS